MDKQKNSQFRQAGSFTLEERRQIISEYLESGVTKSAIWFKYTGDKDEHGNINRWMRQLGLVPIVKDQYRFGKKCSILPPQSFVVVRKEEKELSTEELKKRIKDLQQQLETAQLKAEGYEIMIDIAEKELNIPIRKKSGTK